MKRVFSIALTAFFLLALAGCTGPSKFQCPDGSLVENSSQCAVPPGQACPACDDSNPCTTDKCSAATNYTCVSEPHSGELVGCSGVNYTTCMLKVCEVGRCVEKPVSNCCGNAVCEGQEDYSACPSDCPKPPEVQNQTNQTQAAPSPPLSGSRLGVDVGSQDYPNANELGVHWNRPMTGPFDWNQIERSNGTYDFTLSDEFVKRSQENGYVILAVLWPYNSWDQSACRGSECKFNGIGTLSLSRCAPCSLQAYGNFVKAVVERYDGDNASDMPGLKEPIKYWEVMSGENEEGLNPYFKGTPFDYANILKTSYQNIKSTCASCEVLYGSVSDVSTESANYFENTLIYNSQNYFYIMSLQAENAGEGMNLMAFQNILNRNKLQKTIWVTGAAFPSGNYTHGRYGQSVDSISEEEQANLIVRGYAFAFGNGVEKVFYSRFKEDPSLDEETNSLALVGYTGRKKPAFQALKFMASQIDNFTTVEKLDYGSDVSAFKFIVPGKPKPVYIIWSIDPKRVSMPTDSGAVKVSNVFGNETYEIPSQMKTAKLTLTHTPIYVEET